MKTNQISAPPLCAESKFESGGSLSGVSFFDDDRVLKRITKGIMSALGEASDICVKLSKRILRPLKC